MLREYSEVVLTSTGHESEGVRKGMIGYVITAYGDGNYEVEFSDSASGVTIAQIVLNESELAIRDDEN